MLSRSSVTLLLALCATLVLAPHALPGDRVPGEHWLAYADPADAGFDPDALAAAHASWEALPSSAFLVIADGAVVAAWGDVERRFMCHSVRKSFLSALYGIAWDRGEIELNKTMADLGIDDAPSPLMDIEKQARILDLLKARSAVYHPAAYAGRTDSAPRGSIGPGQAFGYNNWDFNTLAAILTQETGMDVFEGFDEFFGQPLQMEDWRVSDGYYHYELDKSKFPAYPFRMSARDAARFGLLFTRNGLWGEERILSKHWVNRSTALYSIDSEQMGYGFMWWVLRKPSLEAHGMVAALGVGNQMIAALPGSDMVIVNRANTYEGESTPTPKLVALIDEVLAARTGTPAADPVLVPLEEAPADPRRNTAPRESLDELVGEWPFPPQQLVDSRQTTATVRAEDGQLVVHIPVAGTFRAYVQPDGSLLLEDSWDRVYVVRDEAGAVVGLANDRAIANRATAALTEGDTAGARAALAIADAVPDPSAGRSLTVSRALLRLVDGDTPSAEAALRSLITPDNSPQLEAQLNAIGYAFLQVDALDTAHQLLALNTRLFPDAFNAWDSLGEVEELRGNDAPALAAYERSLELNDGNSNAAERITELRERLADD